MTSRLVNESSFAPAGFFKLAAARLDHEPPVVAAGGAGDHVLNPDFLAADTAYRDAAVLIPVLAREPSATVLLTVRTPHLRSHAGQIAFPGGKIDPADATPADAALREAEEEVGLPRSAVETVGYGDPYLTRTGYRIFPVVGRVDPAADLKLNPHEVADAFEVPLSFLMTPQNHLRGSRVLLGAPRSFYEMPFEGRYIWGVTAGIIRGLYERMYG
ncbi:MAG: CoA pyrophosphatase [Bauldia sp.]|nr:MAG: CoA pyrophosphatase [Bauldia sp.]MBZ0226837.1 CoA pyrophosphatase [Bauldia sp.]